MGGGQLTQLREWALAYAEKLGFPVFPCRVLHKAPATEHGFKDATQDLSTIRKWWETEPQANIGIPVPKGMVVLDVDGEDAMNQLRAHDLELPATVSAKTPRGWHFWYKGDGFGPAVDVFPDVDIRGPGSYVVAPPSRRTNGRVYRWDTPPKNGNMSEAPDWLYDIYESRSRRAEGHNGDSVGVDPTEVLKGVSEGCRDVTLFRYACRLRGLGYDRSEAEVLVEHAASACTPPFESKVAMRKVEQAWKYDGPPKERDEEEKRYMLAGLLEESFPEPFWLIQDILPEGLTIMFSDAKVGKSFLIGKMCLNIASGTSFLDRFETSGSRVMYMDLEQPPRKAQQRWKSIVGTSRVPDNLEIFFDWPIMGQGGVEKMHNYLTENPMTRMIVVDVLANIWPEQKGGGNAYHWESKQLMKLAKVSADHEAGVVLIHHTNKGVHADWFRESSGSQAMTAKPHTVWKLNRERDQKNGVLLVNGNDVEERQIKMAFQPHMGGWISMLEDTHIVGGLNE